MQIFIASLYVLKIILKENIIFETANIMLFDAFGIIHFFQVMMIFRTQESVSLVAIVPVEEPTVQSMEIFKQIKNLSNKVVNI